MPKTLGKKARKKITKHNAAVGGNRDYAELRVSCGELQIREDLRPLLEINASVPAELMAAMARLPATYGLWANVREEAEAYVEALQQDYDVWHSKVYDAVSVEFPKATETFKEAQIRVQHEEDYRARQAELAQARSALNRLKRVLLKALEFKKDMLQSIGAMVRAELDAHGLRDTISSAETDGNLKNVGRRGGSS